MERGARGANGRIYQTTFTVTDAGPSLEVFNWRNVDDVGFATVGWLVMDNFTYNPVPEPSTLVLLGIATLGLLGYARRRAA